MQAKETDFINELRQALYPVFATNGVNRAVAYQNKDRVIPSIDGDNILIVESGLKGMDFCVLLDEIQSVVEDTSLSVLDIQHYKQWSEIDKEMALAGTEIYCKETSENEQNHRLLQDIRDIVLKVQKYCNEFSYEQFEENSMLTEACEYNLRLISILADHIEVQFKEDNPQIPWNAICGFQWKLAPSIAGANKILLWEIIKTNFPELLGVLEYVIRVETPKDDPKKREKEE